MFRLVPFFLMTSAAAATAIAGAYFVHRQNEVERLIEHAEVQNIHLARAFSNTIWPSFAAFVMSDTQSDEEERRGRQAITRAVKLLSAELPILKVKLYDLKGQTVYSTDPAEIGEYKKNNPGFFSAARDGKPASKLTYQDNISSFEGAVQDRDVVESYLPIREGDGLVQAVFELYTDVTPLIADMEWASIQPLLGFLPAFTVLYVALFLIVRRADQTIKRQYADIVDKNTKLENEVSERMQAERELKEARDQLEQKVEERSQTLYQEIAERRQAEKEAQRHRNELAHFGRISTIGEMATSLAHELNQPLTVISGSAQLCVHNLREQGDQPKRLLHAMEQMAEQANRAIEIVRRIRGFVKKNEPVRELVDVNRLIRSLAGLLHTDAREHGSNLKLELAEQVPLAIADPIQIQQVILNLAHNGIEAMGDIGAAEKSLFIRTFCGSDQGIEIAVSDRGAGIPSDQLERVFEPFFTTKKDGLGMGLPICRTIAEAHGGRLWASAKGGGMTFHFTLPPVEDGNHERS